LEIILTKRCSTGGITNTYGPQMSLHKESFLKILSYLAAIVGQKRWIMGGNFNTILSLKEKRGVNRRMDNDNNSFQKVIDDLCLVDLNTINRTYTWSNRQSVSHQVAFRLDRFLISESLVLEGHLLEANILPRLGSYHWSIQLWLDTLSSPHRKPFIFRKLWLTNSNFQENAPTWWVKAAITHKTRMYKFQQKLKNYKQKLKDWNKNVFGNIFQAQKTLEQRMEEIQRLLITTSNTESLLEEEKFIRKQLEDRYAREEILWRKKSRIQWLKEGEKKSKFFPRSMIQRRHINKITRLEDNQGQIIMDHKGIERELVRYFKEMLSELYLDRSLAIRKITQHIPPLITAEQNDPKIFRYQS
jgi:hypothetical protein